MKYYSDYTIEYVQAICDAFNTDFTYKKISEYDKQYGKPFTPENFETLTHFLKYYVAMSPGIFAFLDNKGLVNKGRCPYTGSRVTESSPCWTYLHTIYIYVSPEGSAIMKKEDYDEEMKLFGHPIPKKQYKKKGGCYIATACYGNEFAPEVIILKRYRDEVLLNYTIGKLLIRIYYFISPFIAHKLKDRDRINSFVKLIFLDKFVKRVNRYLVPTKR